jgi:hypothetical protein
MSGHCGGEVGHDAQRCGKARLLQGAAASGTAERGGPDAPRERSAGRCQGQPRHQLRDPVFEIGLPLGGREPAIAIGIGALQLLEGGDLRDVDRVEHPELIGQDQDVRVMVDAFLSATRRGCSSGSKPSTCDARQIQLGMKLSF